MHTLIKIRKLAIEIRTLTMDTILVKKKKNSVYTSMYTLFQIKFANFRYNFANICEFARVCTPLNIYKVDSLVGMVLEGIFFNYFCGASWYVHEVIHQ